MPKNRTCWQTLATALCFVCRNANTWYTICRADNHGIFAGGISDATHKTTVSTNRLPDFFGVLACAHALAESGAVLTVADAG
ncbi:hypothetical protein MHM91_05140 [Neisseriaceae bacterium CCUG 44465]|uniref:hypothetical protein n=1 Tax=Wielerella bovis TaxID=2917790 RepID=UPI0020186D13|nr:hypothetical protein [Wielerella bovis]MCG7659093.1 hypothetical protein [Wielerella bovis]